MATTATSIRLSPEDIEMARQQAAKREPQSRTLRIAREVVAERWLRQPRASFVYAVEM